MLFTGTLISEKCSKIIEILGSIDKFYIVNIDRYCWEFKNYNDQYFIKYNIEKEDFINYNLICKTNCTIKINIHNLAKHLKINPKINIQIDDNYNINIIKKDKMNSITKSIIHGEKFVNDTDFYSYDYDVEMIINHIKFRDLVNILIDSNKSNNIINIKTDENKVVNFKSILNGSVMSINPKKSFDDEIDDITNKIKILSMISKKNQTKIKNNVYIKLEKENLDMSYNLDILKYFEPIYNLVKYVNIGLSNNTEIKMDMILDEEMGNMINILVNNES